MNPPGRRRKQQEAPPPPRKLAQILAVHHPTPSGLPQSTRPGARELAHVPGPSGGWGSLLGPAPPHLKCHVRGRGPPGGRVTGNVGWQPSSLYKTRVLPNEGGPVHWEPPMLEGQVPGSGFRTEWTQVPAAQQRDAPRRQRPCRNPSQRAPPLLACARPRRHPWISSRSP